MYNLNEKPLVRATIFYYDNEYCSEYYPKEILKILKDSPFAYPKKYYADSLTQKKFINVDKKFEDVFIKSYTQKDVFDVAITNGDINKENHFWQIDWNYTFFKNSKLVRKNTSYKPWNVISISVSYDWLNLHGNMESLLQCFFKIIEIIKPVYGKIDDVNNSVELLNATGYPCMNIDIIQQIYWGNYFGRVHCEDTGLNDELLSKLPIAFYKKVGDGIFFSLSNDILLFDSREIAKKREKIRKLIVCKKR